MQQDSQHHHIVDPNLNEELSKLNHSHQHWISVLADRIKNPISALYNTLPIIEKEVSKGKRGQSIDYELVNHLLELLKRRVLDLTSFINELAHLSEGSPISPSSFDLNTFLEQVINEFRQRPHFRGELNFSVNLTQYRVYLDKNKLRIILLAALDNALDFIPLDRSPIINLTVQDTAQSSDNKIHKPYFTVLVQDNGKGVHETKLEQLAQPFFSTKELGSGLGLFFIHRYVTAHGGRYELKNVYDPQHRHHVGTCMVITLPFQLEQTPRGGS